MGHKTGHLVWTWIMSNPCFYLFAALLLLLILLPMFQNSEEGKLWFTAMNLPVLVSSVVTLGRSRLFFWVAILSAVPAFALLVASHFTGGSGYLAWSWRFSVVVFVLTLVHLVLYVLRPVGPEEMMIDRLYGGAAAYLLLVLLWCYFYAIRQHSSPDSFVGLGPNKALHIADPGFFSFGRLTTAGGGDLVPQGKATQILVLLEQVAGTLYMGGSSPYSWGCIRAGANDLRVKRCDCLYENRNNENNRKENNDEKKNHAGRSACRRAGAHKRPGADHIEADGGNADGDHDTGQG